MLYGYLGYFVVIWYIFLVLVYYTKKNLATLMFYVNIPLGTNPLTSLLTANVVATIMLSNAAAPEEENVPKTWDRFDKKSISAKNFY
jgi:hypothetical protein